MMGPGWTEPLMQAYGSSFAIIAAIAVVGIAYTYAQNEGHEPLSSGIIALVLCMMIFGKSAQSKELGKLAVVPGFLLGGWRTALLQIVIMLISVVIYFPFFKKQDSINLKNEQASKNS